MRDTYIDGLVKSAKDTFLGKFRGQGKFRGKIPGTVYLTAHVFLFRPRLLPPQNTGDQSFHSLQKGFIS